jgi:copper(I)-binding protein
MTLQGGQQADRLVGASSDRAAMVHLHSVEEEGGVSRMRAIEAVEIPAGQRVTLAPKSTHVMLMGLDAPLVAGQTFVVTLEFAVAGALPVTVTVKPATATDDHAGHAH